MKTMNKRIEELQKQIGNISKSDVADLVFVESVPNGYQIIEDYFKYDSKGQIVRNGAKRKQYVTTESLDTIKSRYLPHTTILEGRVEE